jgi:hypothetical protein
MWPTRVLRNRLAGLRKGTFDQKSFFTIFFPYNRFSWFLCIFHAYGPTSTFSISAIFLVRPGCRSVLEAFSAPRFDLIEWAPTPENNVGVLNDTIDLYRYFDVTRQVEFLYDCVRQTAEETIPAEVDYLKKYDAFKAFLEDRFEMPGKTISLLARFLDQGHGTLSRRAREKEFKSLQAHEVRKIEARYKELFKRKKSPS